jgi:hypothetical protein
MVFHVLIQLYILVPRFRACRLRVVPAHPSPRPGAGSLIEENRLARNNRISIIFHQIW